ncbi:baseplate wedge tail fiber protein connector [Vibrio phage EniLVp02]
MGRKRLNTGQVSVPGSGDTIHDGGNKLHDNFDELYLAFGDQRLFRVAKSGTEEWITPHATGYYQHKQLSEYATPVLSGSMHDINSLNSAGHFPVLLPTIGQTNGAARRGEQVKLQDTSSSWGIVPVKVTPSAGQAITGADSTGSVTLNESDTRATLVVVDDAPGSERWALKVESVSGTGGASVNTSVEIPKTGGFSRVDLMETANYNTIKLMIYGESKEDDTGLITRRTVKEILIMHTGEDTYAVPYAEINSDPGVSVFRVESKVYTNSVGRLIVAIDIFTDEPDTQTVSVAVKSVGSLKQRL